MRIVSRPDFDGIICAVLLKDTEDITKDTLWVEPNDMQKGLIQIESDDIVANLPYNRNCGMWFDHHFTNQNFFSFKGEFRIAPSAAGIIYNYYDKKLYRRDYEELVYETDRIDSADLTADEVNTPENFPYVLVSMTVNGRDKADAPYWDKLVDLFRNHSIDEVMQDEEVKRRCDFVVEQNKQYKEQLKSHTRIESGVAVTDFRSFKEPPRGNRFLVYSMYPESYVQMKIAHHPEIEGKTIVSVGHSIFNRTCNVNVGLMLSQFEGGGHRGAGSCTFSYFRENEFIKRMLDILKANESNEPESES
ncbi:MAG: exopolyphosphatase [Calditrichaeota bacterium]|nr:exopolyphosphatase [Calditrichota bacterium]